MSSLPVFPSTIRETKKKQMIGSPKRKVNHLARSPQHHEWKTYRRSREHKIKKINE